MKRHYLITYDSNVYRDMDFIFAELRTMGTLKILTNSSVYLATETYTAKEIFERLEKSKLIILNEQFLISLIFKDVAGIISNIAKWKEQD